MTKIIMPLRAAMYVITINLHSGVHYQDTPHFTSTYRNKEHICMNNFL